MYATSAKTKAHVKSTVAGNKSAVINERNKIVSGRRPRGRRRSGVPAIRSTSSTTVEAILEDIRAHQNRIAQFEQGNVESIIAIGNDLRKLRKLDPKKWAENLNIVAISDRKARRYIRIAAVWTRRIGPNETGILELLPPEVQKLEALSRLKLKQFRELIKSVDVKEVTRDEVIAAVQKLRGTGRPVDSPMAVAVEDHAVGEKVKPSADAEQGDEADGDEADGDEAEGDKAEGDKAEGDKSAPQANSDRQKAANANGGNKAARAKARKKAQGRRESTPKRMVRRLIQGAMLIERSHGDENEKGQVRRELVRQTRHLRKPLSRILPWILAVIQAAEAGATEQQTDVRKDEAPTCPQECGGGLVAAGANGQGERTRSRRQATSLPQLASNGHA